MPEFISPSFELLIFGQVRFMFFKIFRQLREPGFLEMCSKRLDHSGNILPKTFRKRDNLSSYFSANLADSFLYLEISFDIPATYPMEEGINIS